MGSGDTPAFTSLILQYYGDTPAFTTLRHATLACSATRAPIARRLRCEIVQDATHHIEIRLIDTNACVKENIVVVSIPSPADRLATQFCSDPNPPVAGMATRARGACAGQSTFGSPLWIARRKGGTTPRHYQVAGVIVAGMRQTRLQTPARVKNLELNALELFDRSPKVDAPVPAFGAPRGGRTAGFDAKIEETGTETCFDASRFHRSPRTPKSSNRGSLAARPAVGARRKRAELGPALCAFPSNRPGAQPSAFRAGPEFLPLASRSRSTNSMTAMAALSPGRNPAFMMRR